MRVIIESPFAGVNRKLNVEYARRCMRDSLDRGESPLALHLLYPQVLDDDDRRERRLGMSRAMDWYESAELLVVYMDHSISVGMRFGIQFARQIGLTRENRYIDDHQL